MRSLLRYLLRTDKADSVSPDLVDDEVMKLLNLGVDLLHSVLPFVLSKVSGLGGEGACPG
jgi:hypothetical protein